MKTFFLVLFACIGSGVAAGVGTHYGDNWYFEKHTGFSILEVWYAEAQCERVTRQECSMTGNFLPNSAFEPSKFDVDKGI